MGGAVDVVNASGPRAVGDVSLSIGEDGIVDLRSYDAVKIVIGDDLHADGSAGGKRNGDGGYVMAAVAATIVHASPLGRNAANHDVVHVAACAGSDEVVEALIDLGCARGGDGDIPGSEGKRSREEREGE